MGQVMLKTINIKDFAIISGLSLDFEAGLNVFTGETGAGKSIVIEALGFVLGARGDVGLIREGAPKMIVEAVFTVESLPSSILEKYKITGPEFSVKREFDSKAKGRAWVNGVSVLVADLAYLGDFLVDFHGQHEHQSLFKSSVHLDILDTYAGLCRELEKMHSAYNEVQDIKLKIKALKMSDEEKARALDLYRYQLEEIETLSINPSEEVEIEAALPRLKHSAKLKGTAQSVYNMLIDMDGAALETISRAEHLLNDMAVLDNSLSGAAREIASARAALEDISSTLFSYGSSIDSDSQMLDNMLSRQEALRKIKLKYGATLKDVLAFAATLEKRISDLKSGEENTQKLEKALELALKKLLSLSEDLFEKRKKATAKLSNLVVKEIAPLGFEQVRFEVNIEHTNNPGPKGADEVEFLFSSNPGSALRPLKNIASGGEISRLMLGLKTVLNSGTPVMVFDEIDTGISGHTGKLVGQRLRNISASRQVLCVTHLPQVAVYADKHFNVSKFVKNDNTEVKVETLVNDSKVREIAKMIGSSKTASAGYRHAQDLLQEAGSKF
jgi:DNA repair protein RecN (Recombination protein N)